MKKAQAEVRRQPATREEVASFGHAFGAREEHLVTENRGEKRTNWVRADEPPPVTVVGPLRRGKHGGVRYALFVEGGRSLQG